MLFEEPEEESERLARQRGLEIGPISLQDLFIHLTKDDED
jgi:ABC-2 type transport system ATP-binding protein